MPVASQPRQGSQTNDRSLRNVPAHRLPCTVSPQRWLTRCFGSINARQMVQTANGFGFAVWRMDIPWWGGAGTAGVGVQVGVYLAFDAVREDVVDWTAPRWWISPTWLFCRNKCAPGLHFRKSGNQ